MDIDFNYYHIGSVFDIIVLGDEAPGKGFEMTTYFIINAIARYYKISFVEAKIMYNSRQNDDQYDQCIEWYQEQLNERG